MNRKGSAGTSAWPPRDPLDPPEAFPSQLPAATSGGPKDPSPVADTTPPLGSICQPRCPDYSLVGQPPGWLVRVRAPILCCRPGALLASSPCTLEDVEGEWDRPTMLDPSNRSPSELAPVGLNGTPPLSDRGARGAPLLQNISGAPRVPLPSSPQRRSPGCG